MAQRKSPPAGKPAAKKGTTRPAGKPPTGPAAAKSGAAKPVPGAAARKAPPRKPGKSIVNQKQRPWGLIITTVAIVLFAGAVVGVVIATHKSSSSSGSAGNTVHGVNKNDPYRQPALAEAMKIKGVRYTVEGSHNHVNGTIKYDKSPPIGGNHSQYWANCTGTIYDHQIANENAVHMLEHGAVWITYNPHTLSASGLKKLKGYATGTNQRLAISPYKGLRTPISLQAWGYQLFLNSATDPRISQFISTLMFNPKTTPENASCSDPAFNAASSTLGHPQD
jgi:hypothetical protein